MIVYRLSRKKYKSQLSGKGAALYGGRWNSKGTELIYTSKSRALAMAEVLVHLSLQNLPDNYYMLTIYIPDSIPMMNISIDQLPSGWNSFPFIRKTQNLCDALVQQNECGIIKVPSAVVKGDFNYLINPAYRDFDQIKIVDEEAFPFDDRLVFLVEG